MPSTATGAGSTSCASACPTNAACTTGQLIPCPAAAARTEPCSSTAAPAARRSRPVTRAPGGSSAIDSVNARREHPRSRQRNCRLCQRTASGSSP